MPKLLELFSGTGSIGRAFLQQGWEVTSVDIRADFNPTILTDIMTWDYRQLQPGEFAMVWASPICTHYSRARTTGKTPRDLVGSDRMVQKVLDIIDYFRPQLWAFENPASGLLKDRPVVEGLPWQDVTYCKYWCNYKKWTRVWTNLGDYWHPRCLCTSHTPCEAVVGRKHPQTAQRGFGGGDKHTLEELYSIPAQLCDEIAQAASQAVWEIP